MLAVKPEGHFEPDQSSKWKDVCCCIALVDELINKQINAIIHHPQFQRLEACWRGLYYLVNQALGISQLKIRILDVSWELLARDLKLALEFDQSQLFKKVYSDEFDKPGGEPFGLLIGDYFISHRSSEGVHTNDMEAIRSVAKVAAAAFAPFITAVDPSMFGLNNFSELQRPLNLADIFQQTEYTSWKILQQDEDVRFVGLVMPRVLTRLPYSGPDSARAVPFCFRENIEDANHYLWGNAIYCFAAVVIRAFAYDGWFTNIRGVERDKISGGLVINLPRPQYFTDGALLSYKPAVEVAIGSSQEKELSELGFISLCECKYSNVAAFYSCSSVQRSKVYDREVATINAQLSAMLHYILCVSRFAHYIKIIGRNKVGSFSSAEECENYLQRWLLTYTAATDDMSPANKAKYPLREVKVQVKEQARKPGSYLCTIQLRPYYQPDAIESSLSLVTELAIYQ